MENTLSYGGYALVFEDHFDAPELDRSRWNVELHEPGWVNEELQEYVDRAENICLRDSSLLLRPVKTIRTTTSPEKTIRTTTSPVKTTRTTTSPAATPPEGTSPAATPLAATGPAEIPLGTEVPPAIPDLQATAGQPAEAAPTAALPLRESPQWWNRALPQ